MSSTPLSSTAPSRRQPETARYRPVQRPRRLPDEVAGAIAREIRAGRLQPGDRLPPEHTLATQFGVSRSVVREAVSQIKHDGLVASQQGSGVFVSQVAERSAFRISAECFQKRRDLRKIMELLAGVLSEACFLAAQSPSEAMIAELDDALDRMAADAPDMRLEAEIGFYRCIAAASANEYILQFVDMLDRRVRTELWSVACKNNRAEAAPDTWQEHRRVRNAVSRRTPVAARTAARAHFDAAISRLSRRADYVD